MSPARDVVVELFAGALLAHRLPSVDAIATLTDAQVAKELNAVNALSAVMTPAERRARLLAYPTQADLDAVATTWMPWGEGVRPVVRVVERFPFSRSRPAGTVPA